VNITTHHTTAGLSAAEIRQLFNQIYSVTEYRPEITASAREDMKADVQKIKSTITKAAEKNGPCFQQLPLEPFAASP
jgi:hypothetical protein